MVHISEIQNLLDQLREADTGFRVLGSERHRYLLGPAVPEPEIAEFESCRDIRLPEDYRQFLIHLGNGGTGPYFGLDALDFSVSNSSLSVAYPVVPDRISVRVQGIAAQGEPHKPGFWRFCHQGCGIHSHMMIEGFSPGSIWDGYDVLSPTGLSFGTWYRRWLERAIAALKNECVISRLRVGMSRLDVLAEIDADWRDSPSLLRPVRYLEASDIPVRLEVDHRDLVVAIIPWKQIRAIPN